MNNAAFRLLRTNEIGHWSPRPHPFEFAPRARVGRALAASLLAAVAFAPGLAAFAAGPPEYRSIDGTGNNRADPDMGAANTQLVRLFGPDYGDGVSTLAGQSRPGPREISNYVNYQDHEVANGLYASDWLWQWGQFVDHDIDLTGGADPVEAADIPVPTGDLDFDPGNNGGVVIGFDRSTYDPATGTSAANPRQQINQITSFIDGSNVYGSDAVRAAELRTNDGTGRLKTSAGDLLPFNVNGLPNAGGTSASLFLAGDERANEQSGLTAVHTLFVREHNRWARKLARRHRNWDGERIYQEARRMVVAEIQAITYNEFLPALLGRRALSRYRGYDPNVEAGISNVFSTAAYRFGHSALNEKIMRLDKRMREIPEGHLPLREAFFDPTNITDEGGIEPLLRGLALQKCQGIDIYVVDDVRNFLFGPPGAGGFDLASLNIQRGRDHGLPSYNDVVEALGWPRAQTFADINPASDIRDRLADIYSTPDQIDVWVGGLAEKRIRHAHVGKVYRAILVDQFEALRDGDRFWYQRDLSRGKARRVEQTRLSDIIRWNTKIRWELPRDVFHVPHWHAD